MKFLLKVFETFAQKSLRKVARNCLRVHHRASRIKIFPGLLSKPGPHAVRASHSALTLLPNPSTNLYFSKLENTENGSLTSSSWAHSKLDKSCSLALYIPYHYHTRLDLISREIHLMGLFQDQLQWWLL